MTLACVETASTARTETTGPSGPSVLAVTSELPWPLNTGGHLRTFHLLRALAARFRLRLIAPVHPGQEEAVETLRGHGIGVRPVVVGPRRRWREAFGALTAAARKEPYVCYHRHNRVAVRDAIRQEARRDPIDVLYLDHLDAFVYRPLLPRTPVVVDLHNVYSTLVRRAGEEQASAPRRIYLRREARLLARRETVVAQSADCLTTVSTEDARWFASRGARRVEVVPNGVDCGALSDLPLGRPSHPPTLLYVGAMSWSPNAVAVHFLAREILPQLRAEVPGLRLQIVGRDPGPDIRALAEQPGVEVLGSVPEVVPYLRGASLLAVPLEAGGGTRLKILEAFAAGLPVVSTPVGCEGLDVSDGEQLLIADRARFAGAVLRLLRDPALGRGLAAQARQLARERYDWGIVGRQACAAVAAVVAQRRGEEDQR